MRHCSKCSLTFDDSARICRSCGAILNEVAEDTVSTADETQEAFESVEGDADWTCPKCHELVPETFAYCWNCGSDQHGVAEPEVTKDTIDAGSAGDEIREQEPSVPAELTHNARCAACGSAKIIPNATIVDQGQHSSGSLSVVVYGEPGALIFKDALYSTLTGNICGDCGHVSIRVRNPGELYGRYLQSRE